MRLGGGKSKNFIDLTHVPADFYRKLMLLKGPLHADLAPPEMEKFQAQHENSPIYAGEKAYNPQRDFTNEYMNRQWNLLQQLKRK